MAKRNEPEKLLEVEEVADLLRLHVKTVYEKARAGELPGVKIGRGWRFRPSDVAAYQANLSAPSGEAA